MKFAAVAYRNLLRRPVRSGLTALGIGAAVSSLIVLVSMANGVENAWEGSIGNRGIHILAVADNAVEILTATMDQDMSEKMRAVPGVSDASGELVNLVSLQKDGRRTQVMVRGWPVGSFMWRSLRLKDGALPPTERPLSAVVGGTLAEVLDLAVGQEVMVQRRSLTVAGISSPSGVMNDYSIVVPLETLQELLDRKGKVTEFGLRLQEPENAAATAAVKQRLGTLFSGLAFLETKEIAENNDVIRVFRGMSWGVSAVALGMALLVTLNTLLMAVAERTKEIGILNSLGWSPARIMAMIMLEGLFLGAVGAVIGLAAGIPLLNWIVELPRLRGLFEPRISLVFAVETIAATLALGAVGGLYPALRAARLEPVAALREE